MNVQTPRETDIPRYFLYGEADRDPELRFIHVETIEARSRLHNWVIRPHRHVDLYQVLFLAEGGYEAVIDEARFPLRAPLFIVLPPMVVHGFRFTPETKGYVVTMADGFRDEVIRVGREPEIVAGLDDAEIVEMSGGPADTARIDGHFCDLAREFARADPGRITAIAARLSLIFVEVARQRLAARRRSVPAGEAAADRLVESFRDLIEARFREQWPVADYAGALAVTESRLTAAARQATGRTPLQLIHGRVLLEAKRNLIYTCMTVQEVAYALGFRDPAYFSRFFTQRAGATPAAFRKAHIDSGALQA